MKKFLIPMLVLLLAGPMVADAGQVGFGACGGTLIPIVQKDQGSGMLWGLKVRAKLAGPVMIEPNLNFGSFGDAEIAGVGMRDGSSLKSYGLDLTLGGGLGAVGIYPYLFVGGGVYNTKRDGDATTNKSGWSLGGGLALGVMQQLAIDIRGRGIIAGSEGSTSKKSVAVTAGLTYYFGLQGGGK
jgi:hypothetical protein